MANSSKDKQKNIAKHIAIIMDGNGRWAISNSLNISKGHSKGVEIVRDIVEESVKQNISSLTLYAFSSENWSRPKPEIDAIKKLVVKAINEQVPDLKKQKVKLKFFGEIEDFGSKILSTIDEAEAATSEYEPVLNLNVALGYGGRQDIVNLTKKISSKVKDGQITLEQIDEKMISEFSSSPVEDVDLLIRTGGEMRLSNFLLWNLAYTELMFVSQMWPEFDDQILDECIINYKNRIRNYGE